jgi:hypothetical protein
MDMDMVEDIMPDEADDNASTNVNNDSSNDDGGGFGLFNMISYVATSIQEFVQEETVEFEADVDDDDGEEEEYATCWEVEDEALPPIQSICIPKSRPAPRRSRSPRPPEQQMHGFEVIRTGLVRPRDDERKTGGMGLLKRLRQISVPKRGPRSFKKKEKKAISSFDVVKGDGGPTVSMRYNAGIGNRQKWTSSNGNMRV